MLARLPSFLFLLVLVAIAPTSVFAGFSQGPGNDPRGQTFEGRPFSDEQKAKVLDGIRALAKLKNNQTKACASCMANLLLNKNQRGEARPKLCVETNAQTNKENGATTLPGKQASKCTPKDDAVNVSPQMVNRSKEVLAAVLAHECCHTKQDPKKISEIPCCKVEFAVLDKFKKNANANTKADIDKRVEELTQYCCAAEAKELRAKRSKASKKAKQKIDKRLEELDKICGKKKPTTTAGGTEPPKNDKPKISGGGTSKIVQGENANYSIFSDHSTLYSNLRSDNNNQLSQYPLERTYMPGSEIEPIHMLLRNPDELLLSENHALIITAFDEEDTMGLIKTIEVNQGNVIVEYEDIELPGSKPIDAAFETDLPIPPYNRLYVFDDLNKEILCLSDNDSDGLPDSYFSTYAKVIDFPELALTRSISLYGNGDGGNIALSEDDLRNDDVVIAPANVVVLFDDNGDCIADFSEAIEIQPAANEE